MSIIKNFLIILSFFIVHNFNLNAQEKFSRIKINIDKNIISELSVLGIPIDDAYQLKNSLILEISETDIQKLHQNNILYELLISDVADYYVKRNAESSPVIRTEKTPENFNLGTMGGYLTNSEMLAELDQMRTLYPNLITVKQSISSTFTTHEGNTIYYVKISDNPETNEEEPELLYTGMHHAREPMSMMHLIYYMWYLLENYETDPMSQYIVDNFELYFVPIVNPDGYLYNQQTNPNGGGMFRKNRRNNGDGTYGVDINRNYPYMWGIDDYGSSGNPDDETYRGPSEGSEPEVQAMMEFISNNEFLILNNHHTYSNLMLYPYGYSEDAVNPELELFETYAQIMTQYNNFACGHAWDLLSYTVNGEANDWAYKTHGIYAFTAETGSYDDNFWPTQDRIIPLCEGNFEMNYLQALLAGPYAYIIDASEIFTKRCGYSSVDVKFVGLDTNATFKVYLSGENIIFSDTLFFEDYGLFETRTDSIYYALNEQVAYGDEFVITINIDNGNFVEQKNITKKIQKSEIFMNDACEDMTNWNSSAWNTTNSDYHSENNSITDSPSGDYQSGQTNTITSNSMNLSNVENAILSFWAKWEIEAGWDYVQVSVSDDGGISWNPLTTENTITGNGGVQPYNEPVFDGTQKDWINQTADISDYISNNIKIKFELGSDEYVEYDGFYFDDIQIMASTDDIAPEIISQNAVNVQVNQPRYIFFDDLNVQDEDDTYPNGFCMMVYDGEHYSLTSNYNEIQPEQDYIGPLTIPVRICDGYKMSEIFNINANVVTSVEVINCFKFDIYPNPAQVFVNIAADNFKFDNVKVIDITGKVLKNSSLNSDVTRINVADLEKGIYFVQISGDDFVMQKALIIN